MSFLDPNIIKNLLSLNSTLTTHWFTITKRIASSRVVNGVPRATRVNIFVIKERADRIAL